MPFLLKKKQLKLFGSAELHPVRSSKQCKRQPQFYDKKTISIFMYKHIGKNRQRKPTDLRKHEICQPNEIFYLQVAHDDKYQ